tara:strand:- start:15083 stop:15337 length:255 start_codon:yes stop_codon:yes gene_type:complete
MNKWFVYIIETRLNTLYTGITNNVARRLKEHQMQNYKTAKYLRGKDPLTLVYIKEVISKNEALKLECLIKKLSKKEKIDLIKNS